MLCHLLRDTLDIIINKVKYEPNTLSLTCKFFRNMHINTNIDNATKLFEAGYYNLFCWAIKLKYPWDSQLGPILLHLGYYDVVVYLFNNWPHDVYRFPWNSMWCNAVVGLPNNIDEIKYLFRSCFFNKNHVRMFFSIGYENNNKNKIKLLRWLHDNGCPWDYRFLEYAIYNEQSTIIQWALDNDCPLHAKICNAAVYMNNKTLLEKLRGYGCPWSESTTYQAAKQNNIEILNWLVDNGCTVSCRIMMRAVMEGNLTLVKWSKKHGLSWNCYTCIMAAEKGNLEILKWLRNQKPPCPWNERVCLASVMSDQLNVLQWLRNQDPPCPWNNLVITTAEKLKHYDIMEWAIINGCPLE